MYLKAKVPGEKLYTANEVAYTKTTFRIYCYSYYELFYYELYKSSC